jgi:4-nitrophenyl phosphatase
MRPSPIKALILDMDGVLWRADQPIGDLPAVFAAIRQLGLQVSLATNNSTLSVTQYVEKLARFGVSLGAAQIINSGAAAAHLLRQQHPAGGRVYLVGEAGLTQALADQGFAHAEEQVVAVVAGLDRQFTYQKLNTAMRLVRGGAQFIATNTDSTYPNPDGLIPGAGSIVAAIERASGVKPVVAGKPSPRMYEAALGRMGVSPAETLVVGDRLDTDIEGAQQIGCPTALVLSGVTDLATAGVWQPAVNWIVPDLAALLRNLAEMQEPQQ